MRSVLLHKVFVSMNFESTPVIFYESQIQSWTSRYNVRAVSKLHSQ